MSAPKWTPGPWGLELTAIPGKSYHVKSEAPGIGRVADVGHIPESWGDADANAYLIAAAPDMAEALEKCASWMADHGCVPPCLTEAKAALARARGEVKP